VTLLPVSVGASTENGEYLRANHCDQMQGYLFSRPLPPGECVSLMRGRQRQAAA